MELFTRVSSFLAIYTQLSLSINWGKFITIRINRIMDRLVFIKILSGRGREPTIGMGVVKHHTGHFRVISC